jgi:hypothetical protein
MRYLNVTGELVDLIPMERCCSCVGQMHAARGAYPSMSTKNRPGHLHPRQPGVHPERHE